ncbi:MAG: class I SAM-dependent methyltransferase [Anaerolineales bacterium]|nr:class I SAM-dependent methyltransferase [Anaerolineales bacterium]
MNRLYWLGNAAKTKIIAELLRRAEGREVLIFDYGCGQGGDWARILTDYPHLRLVGYDPSAASIAVARARLQGCRAEFFSGAALPEFQFKADFVVSFSVLEHVYDRPAYIHTLKARLADRGLAYLNYDDGHFRQALDLGLPRAWPGQVREWLDNQRVRGWARLGRPAHYQARVERGAADRLVREAGLQVREVFYSNLAALKLLFTTVPPDRREAYARVWLDFEDALNARFLAEGAPVWGDPANLWRFMPSRTLVLAHPEAPGL